MTLIISGFVDPNEAGKYYPRKIAINARDGGFDITLTENKILSPVMNAEGTALVPVFETKTYNIFIDPSIVEQKPDICAGYLSYDGSIQLFWDSEKGHTRDAVSSVLERKGIVNIVDALFMVAFSNTGAYLTGGVPLSAAPTGSAQFVPLALNQTPRLWLGQQDPAIQAIIDKAKAKRPLLARVNTIDTVAELEKQVDMLSAMVIALMDKQPAADQPAWFATFKQMIAASSSLQFKTIDECLADVNGIKSGIRALQTVYFNGTP